MALLPTTDWSGEVEIQDGWNRVAQRIDTAQRRAALRPWLLWTVLVAGVAGLGLMVWRLARSRPAPP